MLILLFSLLLVSLDLRYSLNSLSIFLSLFLHLRYNLNSFEYFSFVSFLLIY
jgi:hypothetical protein